MKTNRSPASSRRPLPSTLGTPLRAERTTNVSTKKKAAPANPDKWFSTRPEDRTRKPIEFTLTVEDIELATRLAIKASEVEGRRVSRSEIVGRALQAFAAKK